MDRGGFAGAGRARSGCGELSGDLVERVRARSTTRGDGTIEGIAENESGTEFHSGNGSDFSRGFDRAGLRICESVRAGTFELAIRRRKTPRQNPVVRDDLPGPVVSAIVWRLRKRQQSRFAHGRVGEAARRAFRSGLREMHQRAEDWGSRATKLVELRGAPRECRRAAG